MKKNKISLVIYCLLVVFLSSCTPKVSPKTSVELGVKEIKKGVLLGYLVKSDLPNSLKLLPPPPEEGSVAFQLDQEKAAYYVGLKDEARKEQAIKDADLSFPNALESFNAVLPILISEQTTPNTYMLIRRTLMDAGLSTYSAKNYYKRARPFMVNNTPICTPDDEQALRNDGSYPSGHTAIGWTWALILSEIFPNQADTILHRGIEFGISRNVCNAHWDSDVKAGRLVAAAVVAKLHANKQFLIDMQAAKIEVESLLNDVK